MTDLDAWLDDYKPPVVTTKICGSGDLVDAHSIADAELASAIEAAASSDVLASPEVSEAKRRVDEIQAKIEASEREFKFQGIGHQPWQDLKRKFPPNEKQRRSGLDCDLDRFAPAAIAASAVKPEISPDTATRLSRILPTGEFGKLYEATLQANGQVLGTPKSVLAAFIDQSQQNGGSSTPSLPEESLEALLSDGSDDLSTSTSTTTTDD